MCPGFRKYIRMGAVLHYIEICERRIQRKWQQS
nr:MAG TPA: Putative quorum-sensing-regulated virulence factor [Caudoviricetes sp.]DAY61005.1 MAG TPA: Putative quorum-sensing-regulated virulence factor [Caudoviricetes sp.]